MSVLRLLAVLCMWAAAAAGCGNAPAGDASKPARATPPATAAPEPASGRPRVVALGDSLTAGLGLSQSEAYPALLQKRIDAAGLGFEVVNAGVSGDTSAGGVRRLDWVDSPARVRDVTGTERVDSLRARSTRVRLSFSRRRRTRSARGVSFFLLMDCSGRYAMCGRVLLCAPMPVRSIGPPG